ncbi:MAG: hypothetical protein ACTSSK_13505 [Candidatus Heimdallarchaeota archaeon]
MTHSHEEERKEIEEEIMDEDGTASLETRFNIFRRNFKNHVCNMRILLGILISIGIVQLVFIILIFIII